MARTFEFTERDGQVILAAIQGYAFSTGRDPENAGVVMGLLRGSYMMAILTMLDAGDASAEEIRDNMAEDCRSAQDAFEELLAIRAGRLS